MDWVSVVTPIAMAIVTALVSWGLTLLTRLINNKVNNETAQKYLNNAIDVVNNAVKTTYQTYVQALKETGTFDKDAQLAALEKAKYAALSQLSVDAKNYITEAFGDIDKWLETKIESSIYDLKNSDKTVDKVTK